MKKSSLLCLLIVLLLTGCGSNPGNAKQDAPSREESLARTAGVYLTTMLGVTETDCNLGKPLSVFRLTEAGVERIDYQLFPVFAGDTIVAFATGSVSSVGEYLTGCNAEFPAELQVCFEQTPEAAFAILYAAEGSYCLRESGEPIPLRPHPVPGCAPIDSLEPYRQQLSCEPIQKNFAFTPPTLPSAPAG